MQTPPSDLRKRNVPHIPSTYCVLSLMYKTSLLHRQSDDKWEVSAPICDHFKFRLLVSFHGEGQMRLGLNYRQEDFELTSL